MTRLIILLALLVCHTRAYTQFPTIYKWTKTFESNKLISSTPSCIRTDDSGNVFVLGIMNDTVDFDPGAGVYKLDTTQGRMFVVKLDSAGNFKWAKNFGKKDNDVDYGQLCIDREGNVICICYAGVSVDYDPGPGVFIPAESSTVILKFDNNGTVQWVKSFDRRSAIGHIFGRGIAADEWGNIYINGFVSGDGDFDPGPGQVLLSCGTAPGGDFLCKLDKDANLVWAKLLHCASGWAWWGAYNSGTLALGARNEIYMTGSYSGTADFDPGPGDFTMSTSSVTIMEGYLSKFDDDGNFIWAKRMAGPATLYPCLVLDPWDNLYISGTYISSIDPSPGARSYLLETKEGNRNGFVVKFDSSGTMKWAKGYYSKAEMDYVNHLGMDRRGQLYLRRFLSDSIFLYNKAKRELVAIAPKIVSSVLLKLDSAGNLLGSKILAAPGSKNSVSASYVDPRSNIYAGGSFYDTVLLDPGAAAKTITTKGGNAMFLMKLAQPIPVSLHSVRTAENCSVYPNPTNGQLTLLIDGFESHATVTVLTLQGQQLQSHTTKQNRAELDLSHYPAGMYLIGVRDAERKTYIKVMKQ